VIFDVKMMEKFVRRLQQENPSAAVMTEDNIHSQSKISSSFIKFISIY